MKLAFFGIGKVGKAMALAFFRAGHEISALINRDEEVARAFGARVNGAVFGKDGAGIPKDTDVIFLTVSDHAISETARSLPTCLKERALIAHCSGALPADILEGCARRVSIHPMQTFADIEEAVSKFPETTFGVEGPETERGIELIKTLGGKALLIPSDQKTAYHLAGVFASNHLVGTLNAAIELFERTGASEASAREALRPLVEATVRNVFNRGARASLTGPVKRRDLETIDRHRRYLLSERPSLLPFYDRLVEILTEML